MRTRKWKQLVSVCVIVGALLCACSSATEQVMPQTTRPYKVDGVRMPEKDPCWIVDLTPECIKSVGVAPVAGALYISGVSDVKYEEDDGRLSAQENGTRQAVNNMKAYIKKSVKEAGCSEEKADRIVAESVVQDTLFNATYEGIKSKTWVKKWALRSWYISDGGPEKWKVYALIEVQADVLSEIEKAALDSSKLIEDETRARAKRNLDEMREEGF